MNLEAAKRAVGERAAELIEDGMRVGLGTGSTAAYTLAALGRRIKEEGLRIIGTPTSVAARLISREHGIPMATLDELDRLDIAFDGADEVDRDLDVIKGRGAALTREKVVASLADRFVVLIDESKLVDRLGARAVPVEVLPMAIAPVMRSLEEMGSRPELRMAEKKDGPVVTDQGFWIVDAYFRPIEDAASLARAIRSLPGVLDHGLFVGLATDVLVGREEGVVDHLTGDL